MTDAMQTVTSDLKSTHDVEATPIIPGTSYQELIRLSNDKGEWQFISNEFKIKQRKVTFQFKRFYVHDDGDNDTWLVRDAGEAKIWFQLHNKSGKLNEQIWAGDIYDKGTEREVFLNWQDWIVGPEDFNGQDPGVGVAVEGRKSIVSGFRSLATLFARRRTLAFKAILGGSCG
jgi:hypothetical protein